MSVIVFNRDLYSVQTGKPYINIHQTNRYVLDDEGNTTYDEYPADKNVWRYATDEEVVTCLDNLNAKQVKAIATEPYFAPFVADVWGVDAADEDDS